MKRKIKYFNWTIERFIQKDKDSAQRWGEVWFKFQLGNQDLLWGSASAQTLHKYIPVSIMKEVKATWPKDFHEKA